MFRKIKPWGARVRCARAYGRRKTGLRFEPLENRQLLGVLTPNPLVSAGIVGPDLLVSGAAPEVNVDISESGGLITVTGLTQQYLGTDGNYHTVQTDINDSGAQSQTFSGSSLRDLKVQLQGVDSILTIGDPADPVTTGRDLIISMPANTPATELSNDGIAATTYLNLDIDSVAVGRNLTITIGTNSTVGEAAVVDLTNSTVGSTITKGTVTLRTYGNFPDLLGASNLTVYGDLSVTTSNGNDFIAMITTDVTSRLTVSAGDGVNTVLLTDDFSETVDSSLQTFVTCNPIFGDGLGDGGLTAPGVQQLADDLNTASGETTFSVEAQNLNVYTVGAGNDLVDVHDALIGGGSGGNLAVSASGTGTHVIAVTDTTVSSSSNGSLLGNCTITGGSGDDLVIIDGVTCSGLLSVNTGAGNDVVAATPNVDTVTDAAITDFVTNHPGVFFDGSDPASGNLDINDLLAEILDLNNASSFDVTKATLLTQDAVDNGSWIDISLANVELTMTVTMSKGSDFLAISETKVGSTATVTLGNGEDTVIVTGLGGRAAGDTSNGPPTAEMTQFTLTVGNGEDTVVVSLDYEGEPGYALGNYGIGAAVDNYAADNSGIYNSIEAVGGELDFAAEAMLDNSANPSSVWADKVSITTGNGDDWVTVSDVLISSSITNRLQITLGKGDNTLFFYDNTWDGYANLSGGGNSTTTLDEHRGGNTDDNLTVIGFPNVVPVFF